MGLKINQDGMRRSGFDLLGFPDIDFDGLARDLAGADRRSMRRRPRKSRSMRNMPSISTARRPISTPSAAMNRSSFPTRSIMRGLPGLSNEIRLRLAEIRPRTLGQAGRIEGVTPAALTLLAAQIRRQQECGRPEPGRLAVLSGTVHRSSWPDSTRPSMAPSWQNTERESGRRRHDDRAAALKLFPLPPETEARLDDLCRAAAQMAEDDQSRRRFDAAAALDAAFRRFAAGSGGDARRARSGPISVRARGFPGLVTAIRLADTPGAKVHLIECDQRKCAFLREVSRETQAPTDVHQGRIEDRLAELAGADRGRERRALAPLPDSPRLCGRIARIKAPSALFLKGEHLGDELTGRTGDR